MTDVETLRKELAEARQRQTALTQTLESVARFGRNPDDMLQGLLKTASALCEAKIGVIFLVAGDEFAAAATLNGDPIQQAAMRSWRIPLNAPDWPIVERLVRGEVIQEPASGEGRFPVEGHQARIGSAIWAPMTQEGVCVGVFMLARAEADRFTDAQAELLRSFAAHALIVTRHARLLQDLQGRTAELQDSLEQQATTAETLKTLKTLSRSAFDLDAMLKTLIRSAMALCDADTGGLVGSVDGEHRMLATIGYGPMIELWTKERVFKPGRNSVIERVLLSGAVEVIADLDQESELPHAALITNKSILGVPMLRGREIFGVFILSKRAPGGFTERQIELAKTLSDQAVIAIGNLNLFRDLEARTAELNAALQEQTATAQTLKTLSHATFDLDAILYQLVESAMALCAAKTGCLLIRSDDAYRIRAAVGYEPDFERQVRASEFSPGRDTVTGRVLLSGEVEMISDADEEPHLLFSGRSYPRSVLGVPLLRDGEIAGVFILNKWEPSGFTERQIDLVKTYADQAVIAIVNLRLFKTLEERTLELNAALEQQTTTAEMLKMISHSVFDLDLVLNTLVESAMSLCNANSGYLVTLANGEYRTRAAKGSPPPLEKLLKSQVFKPGRRSITPRVLLSGSVEMIADTKNESDFAYKDLTINRSALGVPLIRNGALVGVFVLSKLEPGGFTERQIELVKTFADQAVIAIGNVQLLGELEQRTTELDRSLHALRMAQDRLIQTEKLTSLGQLAAGIAHEIRNPLNFVSNFSKLSIDLVAELNETLSGTDLAPALRADVEELTQTLSDNLGKIRHHGLRADSIVKNMLLHARQDGGAKRAIDLNAMIEESLNLAYHGARAERSAFNITLQRQFDRTLGKVEVYPQELTRVLLNLFSNGFYAAQARAGEPGFEPCLKVSTKSVGDLVEIRVRDNGHGVPDAIREKLFTPFFTTKPAGEGTGLGLSISYEIIVKQHGGSLSFESEPGQFTEFLIALPLKADRERYP